jgi:hypothetical protein
MGLDPMLLRDLNEIEALAEVQADLIVTEHPEILRVRDHPLIAGLPIVTPQEAFVIVGVWSRLTHRPSVFGPIGINVGLYYWCLARALTPAAWPGFAAFLRAERVMADGPDNFELAASVLDGLARLGRGLDGLFALWQCPGDNDVNTEMTEAFDHLVRDLWRLYDNLAQLSGYFLGISLPHDKPTLWELLVPKWQKAMVASGDCGKRIVDLVVEDQELFDISQQLRHRATHRALFRQMTFAEANRAQGCRVQLQGRELDGFESAVSAMGCSNEDWGLDLLIPAGRVPVKDINDPDVTYEIEQQRIGLLDPMVLAPRLVAHAANLANKVFEILDPETDPRVPKADRTAPPPEIHFGGYAANSAILSSPLAGLIDWQIPIDLGNLDPTQGGKPSPVRRRPDADVILPHQADRAAAGLDGTQGGRAEAYSNPEGPAAEHELLLRRSRP